MNNNNNSLKAGLWEGTSKSGNVCYKGKITIGDKLYYLFLTPCNKTKDNSPNFQLYLSEQNTQNSRNNYNQQVSQSTNGFPQPTYQQNYQPYQQPTNGFPQSMPTPSVDNVKPSDMPTFGNYTLNESNLPF